MDTTPKRITRPFLIGIPILIIALFVLSMVRWDKVDDRSDTSITSPVDSLGNPIPVCGDLGQNDPRTRIDPATGKAVGCVSAQDVITGGNDPNDTTTFETPWLAVLAALVLAYYLYVLIADWKRTTDAREAKARGQSP